jgi:hypothetical protein
VNVDFLVVKPENSTLRIQNSKLLLTDSVQHNAPQALDVSLV